MCGKGLGIWKDVREEIFRKRQLWQRIRDGGCDPSWETTSNLLWLEQRLKKWLSEVDTWEVLVGKQKWLMAIKGLLYSRFCELLCVYLWSFKSHSNRIG